MHLNKKKIKKISTKHEQASKCEDFIGMYVCAYVKSIKLEGFLLWETSQSIAAIHKYVLISTQKTYSLCLLEMVLMQGQGCSIKRSILRFARNHASVLFHTVPVTYKNNNNTIRFTTTSLPSVKCSIKPYPVPTQLRRPF